MLDLARWFSFDLPMSLHVFSEFSEGAWARRSLRLQLLGMILAHSGWRSWLSITFMNLLPWDVWMIVDLAIHYHLLCHTKSCWPLARCNTSNPRPSQSLSFSDCNWTKAATCTRTLCCRNVCNCFLPVRRVSSFRESRQERCFAARFLHSGSPLETQKCCGFINSTYRSTTWPFGTWICEGKQLNKCIQMWSELNSQVDF